MGVEINFGRSIGNLLLAGISTLDVMWVDLRLGTSSVILRVLCVCLAVKTAKPRELIFRHSDFRFPISAHNRAYANIWPTVWAQRPG